MRISTKGRYALRVMIDLASFGNDNFISLKDISQRQNIPVKYLEQIVPILNKSGALITNRGFQGGYQLARSPEQYTVGEILRMTEGGLAPVSCLEHDPILCTRSETCATLFVWQGLHNAINNYLDSITLQDILDKQQESYGNDYMI